MECKKNGKIKVGAHVSISGGIWKAPQRVASLCGNTLQIFSTSPRSWRRPKVSTEDREKFKKLCKESGVSPVFVHAKYLISLGNKKKSVRDKSITSLLDDLETAQGINACGVIFHPSGEDFELLIRGIKKVLENIPPEVSLIVENTAQAKIEWMAQIFRRIDSSNLKFCLDTAHLYEAGYDLGRKEVFKKLLGEIENKIGLEKLVVIHANDSKTKLASRNDKHENIGKGAMGEKVFKYFLKDERTRHLPFILETPAFKEKEESQKEEIKTFKRLAE